MTREKPPLSKQYELKQAKGLKNEKTLSKSTNFTIIKHLTETVKSNVSISKAKYVYKICLQIGLRCPATTLKIE